MEQTLEQLKDIPLFLGFPLGALWIWPLVCICPDIKERYILVRCCENSSSVNTSFQNIQQWHANNMPNEILIVYKHGCQEMSSF